MSETKSKHVTEYGDGLPADSPGHVLRSKLPHRDWQQDIHGITSLVILPTPKSEGLHDSGYRCMDFAACHYGTAHCLLSGCSDVIHIGGIGGYNTQDWLSLPRDGRDKRVSWSIDCLPNSGLLQLFADGEILVGSALSSFEVWALEKRPEVIRDE